MKLHILSDLHLNVAAFEVPETDADIVVLAGDIARPKEAIAWASAVAKPLLYVPGNHEYYGGSIASTVEEMRQLCCRSDIYVLDNDAVVIDGVRFLGTTLWTDFQLFGGDERRDLAIDAALNFMHDFSRIRMDEVSETLFTPAASAVQFTRHANWLEERLAESFQV